MNKNAYEVFLCACPAHFPLSVWLHTWFVINEAWELSRYEMLFRKNTDARMWYLHIDDDQPFSGLGILPLQKGWKWRAKILSSISGEKAKNVIAIIRDSQENYPHLREYSLIGPNSNTYTQWVLDAFPEWEVKLPWNAFWKNA